MITFLKRLFQLALLSLICTSPLRAEDTENEKEDWDVNDIPGEAREISIDVREGTWMSLDVSPDGKSIAFDLLGDIYVLPLEGGEAKALTRGLAWDMQPRYSPDGTLIAFTSDRAGGDNIWIMNTDGSMPRQISDEDFRLLNNPTWSPDGRFVAARKHYTTRRSLGTGEIWLYHLNGGKGTPLVEKPSEDHQKELGEPMFSPDGQYLYYSQDTTPGSTFVYAQDSNAQIFEIKRYDLERDESAAFVSGPGGSVRPAPSPDGRYLAFVRRIRAKSALYLKDLQTGEERPIYTGLDQDVQEVWAVHGVYPNMDWTPDSKSIVFWAGGKINRIDIESLETTDIPFHVADTRTVYTAPRFKIDVAAETFSTKMIRYPAVSPDGGRVVFESAGRLYIKTLPDGLPQLLTRDAADHLEFFPSWSRDGRWIVFVSWDDQTLGQIRKVRPGGGRSQVLSEDPGHYREPHFSPDGQTIVFQRAAGGNLNSPKWSTEPGVYTMPASGGPAALVTMDGKAAHFGARGDRVFLTRTDPKKQYLVSVDLDGKAAREHANATSVSRFVVSPDESHLAFRENYHVYALPLPPGGKSLEISPKAKSFAVVKASGDGGNFPNWSKDGGMLNWSLGPILYQASIAALFERPDSEEDEGYLAPKTGVSLAVVMTADVPKGKVALTGARIVTMNAKDGGVIENGVILVNGNRITAVGAANDVELPAEAKTVDVSGKTIVPGLIDAHAHGPQADGIIPEQNWENYATLAFGVTTIHDPSNQAANIFAASEMQRAGIILAPRIFSTGEIIYGAKSPYFADINSLEEAREHVRRLKAQGAISVKNYNQPRRDQRQQVVVAAREEDMMVVAEGASLYHMDLSMVADGNTGIEHNLPQSTLYDDVLQFWSQTNVGYTPTLVVTYGGPRAEDYWYQVTEVWKHPLLTNYVPPHVLQPRAVRRQMAPMEDYYHTRSAATAKSLADEDVIVNIGAHGQREGLASHWEMWSFAQGGMSPIEALATATINPARYLGFDDDVGSLEPGKLADLIVIDGDVSTDIFQSDQVEMVMLNGRLYEASTLSETVTGDRKTEKFYWQQ